MNKKLLSMIIMVLIVGLVISALITVKSQYPGSGSAITQVPGTPVKIMPISVLPVLEKSYNKGLGWLMAQQLQDGSWPDIEGNPDVAFTALTLISIGSTTSEYRTRYKNQIAKGIKYLLDHQQDNGSFLNPGKIPSLVTYKTPLTILALVGLDKEKHKEAILRARNYLEGIQNKNPEQEALFGGWSETGRDLTPKPGLTITNFVMDSLRQADLPQDSETWKRAVVFLQRCQDSSESNDFRITANSGGFAHSPIDSKAGEETLSDGTKVLKPYGSMTHAGLMSFLYAFVDKNDHRVRTTYTWLKQHYTIEENPGLRTDIKPSLGQQGLFYYFYTLAKALDAYGEQTITSLPDKQEHIWAEELAKKIALLQRADGSWTNKEPRWWEDDPRVVTPYCLIALNICRKWIK